MMSLWDALRMNMMISYQELVRTFPRYIKLIKRLSFFDNVSNLNILIDDKPLLRRENVYGVRESDNLAFDINALCKFTEYKGADKSAEK